MKLYITIALFLSFTFLQGQENPNPLPKHLTETEKILMDSGLYQAPLTEIRESTNPPDFPTRTLGEWEELQAIVVTWDAYFSVLREIVRYAKDEVEVINVCQDSNSIKLYLSSNGIDFENLRFIEAPFNTVWVRDYGPNPVYKNDVDSLVFVDWIYNRPRPRDDVIPDVVGSYLGIPVYSTTTTPYDLVHTGGNFMADGLGTGFSSELVLEENDLTNQYGSSNHSEKDIEELMHSFMGIQEYPKMETLPYDGIHHIDMHMKMLDEQTLLFGTFPQGISDGPQLEENIQFVLDNYKSYWGTDFRVERILQPPCGNGNYPPSCQGSHEYRTYTNALFVNKTILVPIYNTSTDEEALDRWQELMPGYKIRGIDCRSIINAGGAIHCVTKEIGVKDPLWIAHRELDDIAEDDNIDDYFIEAKIKHRSGIAFADLFWTTDTSAGYEKIDMTVENPDEDTWAAYIPQQIDDTQVYYYIKATANSGKTILRPLPAPEGYFSFHVEALNTSVETVEKTGISISNIFPNPSGSMSVIELIADKIEAVEISILDILGQEAELVYQGMTQIGKNQYYLQTDNFTRGTYWIRVKSLQAVQMKKLIVQ